MAETKLVRPPELMDLVTHPNPELVFGVVAPVGTHFEEFQSRFTSLVSQYRYETNVVRLSEVAERFLADSLHLPPDPAADPTDAEYDRINRLMTLGTKLREEANRGDFLALHGIAEILKKRVAPSPPEQDPEPIPRTVHLLRSLKHPHEVEALRRVYGPGFFLIAIHSREEDRLKYLIDWKGIREDNARRLIARDQSETEKLGQQTRDTFALADVFISSDDYDQLARFFDLVFGNPFITPTQPEYAMSLAYAASLRSAQLGRQVGAVVVSEKGDVIATGANDVPCFGGGLYWPGDQDTDCRDHNWEGGGDSNRREVRQIIGEIASQLCAGVEGLAEATVVDILKAGPLSDVTEYGRVVHAEMEALLAAARIGARVAGGSLFTTTFPCHNCAKHIVAAGITKVVYVEPYAKSKAEKLHSDSISINDPTAEKRVQFLPFVGVAARRYFDLFSMSLSNGLPRTRRDASGEQLAFKRPSAKPRLRMSPFSYMRRERIAIRLIPKILKDAAASVEPTEGTVQGHSAATPPTPTIEPPKNS